MELATKIQWADFTWNRWRGCIKVDSDCLYCYFYRDMNRHGKKGRDIVKISDTTLNKKVKAAKQLAAERKAIGDNTPVRIFVSSWTDVFLAEAQQEWREDLWRIARENPELILMILTKRPELIPEGLPADWGKGYQNVWLGTSVGSGDPKKMLRIVNLLKVNAALHFLSLEPLIGGDVTIRHIDADGLGDKDWCQIDALTGEQSDMAETCLDIPNRIKWVIVGGESGNDTGKYRYRPCNFSWIRTIVVECKVTGVPVYVKQLGTHLAKQFKLKDRHGGDPSEWTEWMRTQVGYFEHPNVK
jgi:protein gp37